MQTDKIRILVAEDMPAIQDDYRRILAPEIMVALPGAAKFAPELALDETTPTPVYALTCVSQGEAALAAADNAASEGEPFSLAFIDVRMPPGMDGVQTARELRRRHPDLQIVLCTAFADYSYQDIMRLFPATDGVLLLKKPFDPSEIRQLAYALTQKWWFAVENRRLIINLEDLVAARTAQLASTGEQLAIALRDAQAANRAKHAFLRCVSHELNTPLNGVHGAASILGFSGDAQTREMGRIITESSNRLQRLFARILLYLELESAPSPPTSTMQVASVLALAIDPQREAARAKGISLRVTHTTPPAIEVAGRPQLFITAVENLVENAIKFTPSGEVHIDLTLDTASRRLILRVTDTGIGLTPAKLADIGALFDPGDTSFTRRQDGLGIGLALISRIAGHLGGEITARAGLNSGSVFTLTIPCPPRSAS